MASKRRRIQQDAHVVAWLIYLNDQPNQKFSVLAQLLEGKWK